MDGGMILGEKCADEERQWMLKEVLLRTMKGGRTTEDTRKGGKK